MEIQSADGKVAALFETERSDIGADTKDQVGDNCLLSPLRAPTGWLAADMSGDASKRGRKLATWYMRRYSSGAWRDELKVGDAALADGFIPIPERRRKD
jgi:hypothetical protein